MSRYSCVLAMNVRVGEWIFICPRDKQVKGIITSVDETSPELLMMEIVYVDGSQVVLPGTCPVFVAHPVLKRPELTLIPQMRDPGWSRYHRSAREYRDSLARDAASWNAYPETYED